MREHVEYAGPRLSSAWLRWEMRHSGCTAGRCLVGSRVATWCFQKPDTVIITNSEWVGGLAVCQGVIPQALSYPVRMVTTLSATGGQRWWWKCPGCGRRCESLYLTRGRDRLACRQCCQLVYRSQYRHQRRTRKRRPAKKRTPE
jgi:hypothetical protein